MLRFLLFIFMFNSVLPQVLACDFCVSPELKKTSNQELQTVASILSQQHQQIQNSHSSLSHDCCQNNDPCNQDRCQCLSHLNSVLLSFDFETFTPALENIAPISQFIYYYHLANYPVPPPPLS